MYFTSLLAAALLTGTPGAPALPSSPLPQLPSETSAETAEGIQILMHLVVEELNSAFQRTREQDQGPSGVYALSPGDTSVTNIFLGDRAVRHSRAFHLPNAGVFLALDAALPVTSRKETAQPDGDPKASDDEWERMRREVRGELTLGAGRIRRRALEERTEIDPAAIERVVDVVLRTLARHASRVEGLAPGDTVTVALHLEGRNAHVFWGDLAGEGGGFAFGLRSHSEDDSEPIEDEDGDESSARTLTYVLSGGLQAPERQLVIRVGMADLTAGGDDPARLRARAAINLY